MPGAFAVNLIGEFRAFHADRRLELPPSCQRLIALAALAGRPVHRTWVCATLWPDIPARSAAARLRTTLWRLRPFGAEDILDVDAYTLALASGVHVDWRHALDLCDRVLSGRVTHPHTEVRDELLPLLAAGALLDGWTDEWHMHERNRFHVTRLSTLGRLSACAAAR